MADEEGRDELEARVRAGEWLTPPQVAIVLKRGRTTIHEWIEAGRIRLTRDGSRRRTCNPEDVLTELEKMRKVHRAGEDV